MVALAGQKIPLVSVVMPMRNAMPFLDKAIGSILAQSFTDFELVIGNDGSTDGSGECAARWAAIDNRIRLFDRDHPSGPSGSGNWVVSIARAPIIARMDADDISEPGRLAAQYALLTNAPDLVLIGSTYQAIDARDRFIRPPDLAQLLAGDPLEVPFAHGSVMLRKQAFDQAGGYREACAYWEDGDLFRRIAMIGRIAVLTQPHYRYRCAATSNRLRSESALVERQLALQLLCRAAFRRKGSYEDVLQTTDPASIAVPVQVFQQRASLHVWAGHRSPALFDWLAYRPRRIGRSDLAMLAYLVLSWISPRLLRRLLRGRVQLANWRVRQSLAGRQSVTWPQGRASLPERDIGSTRVVQSPDIRKSP